jgi:cobalt-zinc-cadmium resistance protein CzcA
MVRKLIEWSLDNPLVVVLLAIALAAVGIYSFANVNVEAYPDPAPAIVEVIALYPGASAEEVERQVTVPLEVTFAGMPGLKDIHSKSLFGLSDLKMNWNYGYTYDEARQEVINRMTTISQPLPAGVIPAISPESPTGEIYRYVLKVPKNAGYTLNDLKALQDWVLEREFRTVPRIVDVTSFGGTVRRYEIQPDPDRLRRYGITLAQLQTAIASSNQTVGGDYLPQGEVALTVRSVGLFGGGLDPVNKVLGLKNPQVASAVLRAEERRRLRDIRRLVITSVNNRPVRVEDVVEGGRLYEGEAYRNQGVVVRHQTRLGMVGHYQPDRERPSGSPLSLADVGHDEPDVVQCIVLLRKGEHTKPALKDVEAKVGQLNTPASGRMLPGVEIVPYYDRSDLVHITTETVTENLLLGIALVVVILFMFISNIRCALIVAINIPLALLFAFSVLFLRGKSANLLSIGAVDFGIIVDSSVIMAENVYRSLASNENAGRPLKERILHAAGQIDHALLFSVLIMVCAFIPLFTKTGPEGQLFGPMAQTYAFALGGALVLAVTLTPVLCLLLLRNLQPVSENWMVRLLKRRYLAQLGLALKYRWAAVLLLTTLMLGTACLIPSLGREFMPELEEGNLWIRGTAPLNIALERQAKISREARAIMATYPEVQEVVNQMGRPDDGTDSDGYYNSEFFVPLRPQKSWPALVEETGWRRWFHSARRPRTKNELITAMNTELNEKLPGVGWNFSQNIRDNVMEALSGVKGDNSVKIFGPDIDKLEDRAAKTKAILEDIPGVENVVTFHVRGQSHLEFRVDPEKCQKTGTMTADVNNVVGSALGAQPITNMIEGEKLFPISIRWPQWRRSCESSILEIPVDFSNNQVILPQGPNIVPSATGHGQAAPVVKGTLAMTDNPLSNTPRVPLRSLVTPVDAYGDPNPGGQFQRPGASTIYREQGKRLIAIKFSVRGRDLAGAVREARRRTDDLFEAPYRSEWSGEFEQMEDAERRLMSIIPLSLVLIFILLYSAFRSFLDALAVFSNVFALAIGGIWALYLTGTNFSISAAVGFVSLFGIAIMDGLLMISYFNALRAQGLPLRDAILQGAEKRVRPVMMTALTAILGLLPAALALRPAWDAEGQFRWVEQVGSQTQRPLAIVVVGGMLTTLFLTRYLMPVLYSFYGHRQPAADGAGGLAH